METAQQEIQFHSADFAGKVVKVDYSIVDDNGVATVKQQLPIETLESYIDDNDLNVFNYLVFDDYETERQGADYYLRDNLHEVVEAYLYDQLS